MKLSSDTVPSTVEGAVDAIVAGLEPEEEKFIVESASSACIHHTVGRGLRNGWSLWAPDSPLKRDAVETYGIAHADDISGLIIEWVWSKVWEIPFDPMEHVKSYHEHWARYGKTSLEAGGWPPNET